LHLCLLLFSNPVPWLSPPLPFQTCQLTLDRQGSEVFFFFFPRWLVSTFIHFYLWVVLPSPWSLFFFRIHLCYGLFFPSGTQKYESFKVLYDVKESFFSDSNLRVPNLMLAGGFFFLFFYYSYGFISVPTPPFRHHYIPMEIYQLSLKPSGEPSSPVFISFLLFRPPHKACSVFSRRRLPPH